MHKILCGVILFALAAACGHARIARNDLERRGCTDIVLKKSDGEYEYTARCGEMRCDGTMRVRGTRFNYSIETDQHCSS